MRGSPWVLVPATICLGYLAAVMGLIVVSLHKKANENQIAFVILSSLLGLYNIFLIAIVVVYVLFNYALNPDMDTNNRITWEFIKYLTIINFGCLVVPIFMHLFTHPMRVLEMLDPRTFLSYLYYQAAYTHTFVIYAFSNVDDVTWGTKGAQHDKSAALKTSQKQ
jgi:chitin synthase